MSIHCRNPRSGCSLDNHDDHEGYGNDYKYGSGGNRRRGRRSNLVS